MKSFKEYITESGINLGKKGTEKSIKLLHHTDLDGISSATMAYNQLLKQGVKPEQIVLVPVQYGANAKDVWNLKKGQKGVVVDFGDFGDETDKVLGNKDYWVSDHHEKKDIKQSIGSVRHGSDSSSSAIRKVIQNKLDEIFDIKGVLGKQTQGKLDVIKGKNQKYKSALVSMYNDLRKDLRSIAGGGSPVGMSDLTANFDRSLKKDQLYAELKKVYEEKSFDKKIEMLKALKYTELNNIEKDYARSTDYNTRPIDTSMRNREVYDRLFDEFIKAVEGKESVQEAINKFLEQKKYTATPQQVNNLAKITNDYFKHSKDMKQVYKSDTSRLATFHTQNIADQKFISDLKRVDSADFTSLEKLVKMDDSIKENFAHISNSIISKMIKPDMVHGSANTRTTGITEYLIRNAKPTLISFLNTMFSKKGQELIKAESSFYKNRDAESLSKLSKTTKRKALQGSTFHEEKVITDIEKLLSGNWQSKSKEIETLANKSGWEDYKIKEFTKPLYAKDLKGMKEALQARKKDLNFIDKAGRRNDANDASSYKAEIATGREKLKGQIEKQMNPETSNMVKVSSVLMGAESPKDMNRFLPPVLKDKEFGRFPVYFRSWNDMIQFAVNSDLDKETASRINLVEIGKQAIQEIKSDTSKEIRDIHSKYGYDKTLFDFGIEKVEKQVGGHKPIVTISKLSMPTLAPKNVRQISDKEKDMEVRIKKLEARGINVEPLKKQLEDIKAKNLPKTEIKDVLSAVPKVIIKRIVAIVNKKLQEVLKGSTPTYKETDASYEMNMKKFEPAPDKEIPKVAAQSAVSNAAKNIAEVKSANKTYLIGGKTFPNKDWLKNIYKARFNAPDKNWIISGNLTDADIASIKEKEMTVTEKI